MGVLGVLGVLVHGPLGSFGVLVHGPLGPLFGGLGPLFDPFWDPLLGPFWALWDPVRRGRILVALEAYLRLRTLVGAIVAQGSFWGSQNGPFGGSGTPI